MSIDPKSYELARHFLQDAPELAHKAQELASEIQKAVEDWFEAQESQGGDGYPADWPRCPACGRAAMDGHITCGRLECWEGSR